MLVVERILNAKCAYTRDINAVPVFVYLGRRDVVQLLEEVKAQVCYTNIDEISKASEQVHGMEIIRVARENFLQLGERLEP